jgi:hypothetical protein
MVALGEEKWLLCIDKFMFLSVNRWLLPARSFLRARTHDPLIKLLIN